MPPRSSWPTAEELQLGLELGQTQRDSPKVSSIPAAEAAGHPLRVTGEGAG